MRDGLVFQHQVVSQLTAALFWGLELYLSFRMGERVKIILQHREAERTWMFVLPFFCRFNMLFAVLRQLLGRNVQYSIEFMYFFIVCQDKLIS